MDLNQIFPIKPSEFQISFLVESCGEKLCLKFPKFLRCLKAHYFQTVKDIDPTFL